MRLKNKLFSKRKYRTKELPDGRKMLNLGCGSRTHWGWNNIDFSLYGFLRKHTLFSKFLKNFGLLSAGRFETLGTIDSEIIRYNIIKGIPFPDSIFDVVYHSHLLEHLNRRNARCFLKECYRVLKPKGIMRVVIPDLEKIIIEYYETLSKLKQGYKDYYEKHEKAIEKLFEQMVREEAVGTSRQRVFLRKLENLIRGNAQSAGEVHKWMYDKFSLIKLLSSIGFKKLTVQNSIKSQIKNWNSFNLDTNQGGEEYLKGSLYIEGVK